MKLFEAFGAVEINATKLPTHVKNQKLHCRKTIGRVKAKSTKISFSAKTYPEPEGARWKQNFSGRYEDQLSADKKSALDGLS